MGKVAASIKVVLFILVYMAALLIRGVILP